MKIGVTGHRVLAETHRVQIGIRYALSMIQRVFGDSSPTLYSSLAEGADRLVAECVPDQLRGRIVVPLPLTLSDYMEDFRSPESKAQFDELLGRAEEVVPPPDTRSREEGYQAAGNYVLDHCDALLAVWDGKPAQGRAGTGHVVARAREMSKAIAWVHAGNREPGTMRPTSLGAEQGEVTFENFPISFGDIPFRIRIGVAGGQIACDPDELKTQVTEILPSAIYARFDDQSKEAFASTRYTRVGLSVVTSLGSEAERLITETVLQLDADQIAKAAPGMVPAPSRVEAVIPAGREEYLQRFPDSERQSVSSILERDRHPVIIDEPTAPAWRGTNGSPLTDRERKRLARYVVDSCDLVVELSASGGSIRSEIDPLIHCARERARPLIRIRHELANNRASTKCRLIADPQSSGDKEQWLSALALARLEEFNGFEITHKELEDYVENQYVRTFEKEKKKNPGMIARAAEAAKTWYREGQRILSEMFGRQEMDQTVAETKEDLPTVSMAARRPVRDNLLPYYARASKLAKKSQAVYHRAGFIVWSLFPIAVAAVAIGVLVPALSPFAFGLEFLILLVMLVVVWRADRARALDRWVEHRFLSERLRSGTFLAACGVDASALEVPPHMGGRQEPQVWLAMAFNEIWARLPRLAPCRDDTCESAVSFIEARWLEDQREYHKKKARGTRKKSRWLERAGRTAFTLAMLAALGHLTLSIVEGHFELFENSLAFIGIVLPGIGAAMGGFRGHREYSRISKRSTNMEQALAMLEFDLKYIADTPESLAPALRRTEQLMLSEVQDWLMLMRFAVVEPPG